MQEFTAFNAEKAIDLEKRYVEYKKKHAKEDVDRENEVQKMQIFKDNARSDCSWCFNTISFVLSQFSLISLQK